MPKYTVHVRKADDAAFLSIIERPDWLHWAIHNRPLKFRKLNESKEMPVVLRKTDKQTN